MNQAAFQALMEQQIKGNVYNVVAGVQSEDGRVNLAGAAGKADTAGTPMTADTPYFIASISKMYTAAVIFKMVDQGLVNLDNPVTSYLPAKLISGIHVYKGQDFSSQIKVYQLVNQTSGLADYYEGKPEGGSSLFEELSQGHDRAMDIRQVVEIVRRLPAKFEPGTDGGTKAAYADTNYQLLGAIVEAVAGKPVGEVFQEHICEPLGLTHTYAYNEAAAAAHPPATIYVGERPLHIPKFMATTAPDGGVVATVAESLAFLRAFFGGRLFDAQHFTRMTSRWNSMFFPIQYGYGMMRIKMPRIFSPFKPVPEMIGHSGSTGAFAYRIPEKGLYVAGTVNQVEGPRKPIQLMLKIANAVG